LLSDYGSFRAEEPRIVLRHLRRRNLVPHVPRDGAGHIQTSTPQVFTVSYAAARRARADPSEVQYRNALLELRRPSVTKSTS